MTKFRMLLIIALCVSISGNSLAAAPTVAPGPALSDPQEFEAWLDSFLASYKPSGLAFVLVKDDRIFFQKGYGYADAQTQTPVVPETTIFPAASVSKVFTATAVMQLVEQGRLKLDEDINHYLTKFQLGHEFAQPVTLHHLLTHTSGLDEHFLSALSPRNEPLPDLGDYFARHIPPRVAPPGQRLNYSNHGLALAGYVVEAVSGEPFAEYVERHILLPLGMAHSSFRQPLPPALATDLARDKSRPRQAPFIIPYPAGSLATTASDMGRFIAAHLNGGSGNGARILQEQTIAQMHAQHFSPHESMPVVAYGFFESYANGQHALFHTGDGGAHSLLYLLPEKRIGFYIVFYGSDSQAAVLRENLAQAFLDRYFPAEKFHLPAPPTDFASRAAPYTGTYRMAGYSHTTVEKLGGLPQQVSVRDNGDGTLQASAGGDLTARLAEVGPALFRSDEGGYFAFQPTGDGRKQRLIVSGGTSDPFTAERIAWWENGWLHLALMLAGGLLFVARIMVTPFGWTRARWRKTAAESAPTAARWAWAWSGAVSWLIILTLPLMLLWLVTRTPGPVYAMPWAGKLALAMLTAAAVLGLALPLWAARAWQQGYWTVKTRMFFSLLALAGGLSAPFLYYWNLLGWHF